MNRHNLATLKIDIIIQSSNNKKQIQVIDCRNISAYDKENVKWNKTFDENRILVQNKWFFFFGIYKIKNFVVIAVANNNKCNPNWSKTSAHAHRTHYYCLFKMWKEQLLTKCYPLQIWYW